MRIGFVGLGAMGAIIVLRLMAAGHTAMGWNRSRDKAAALISAGMRGGGHPARRRCAIGYRLFHRHRRRGG